MTALSALTTASTLLHQVPQGTRSATPPNGGATIEKMVAGITAETSPASKSFSSAVFNAVASRNDKINETVEKVLNYIAETYANIEERFASMLATMNPEAAAGIVASAKATGERLKQQVLSDPSVIHHLYESIKANRPDVSKEGVMGFLVVELNNRYLTARGP